MPQIKKFEIETNIPKELSDDGELLDPTFKEKGIHKRSLTPIRWSNQEELNIDTIIVKVLERTMQWLSLRIRSSAAKEKRKGKAIDNPQTKVHKEYVRR